MEEHVEGSKKLLSCWYKRIPLRPKRNAAVSSLIRSSLVLGGISAVIASNVVFVYEVLYGWLVGDRLIMHWHVRILASLV